MADSTLTLADLKTMAEDRLDIEDNSDLKDITVVIAVNEYLRSYIPEEQKAFRTDSELEVTVSIDENGYALSSLTNLADTKSLRIYRGSVAIGNRVLEVRKEDSRSGFYIEDGKINIKPSPSTSSEYVIRYMPKITQFSLSTLPNFSTETLPVRVGAETGAELMVCARYTERDQAEPQKAVNYRNDALAEIKNFFATHTGVATYSMR